MKESEAALRSYGFAHVFFARDTMYDYSIWQKKDLVLIRDNRTGKVITTAALDDYGPKK